MATVKALKQIHTTNKIYEVGDEFEMIDSHAQFHASKGNVKVLTKELKSDGAKTKELKLETITK